MGGQPPGRHCRSCKFFSLNWGPESKTMTASSRSIFTLTDEEAGAIFNEGMNKDPDEVTYMTIYMKNKQREDNQHQSREKTRGREDQRGS